MTPEELELIEKLAEEDMNDPWSEGEGAYRQALRDHALPLVKAVREARKERDALQAVVSDWQRFAMRARDWQEAAIDARAEVERLKDENANLRIALEAKIQLIHIREK